MSDSFGTQPRKLGGCHARVMQTVEVLVRVVDVAAVWAIAIRTRELRGMVLGLHEPLYDGSIQGGL